MPTSKIGRLGDAASTSSRGPRGVRGRMLRIARKLSETGSARAMWTALVHRTEVPWGGAIPAHRTEVP